MRLESRFGPLLSKAGVTFRLWAPAARQVSLIIDAIVEGAPNAKYEDVLGTNPGLRTARIDLNILCKTIPVSILRRI